MEFIENELGKSTWFAGEEVTGAGRPQRTMNLLTGGHYDEFSRSSFPCQGQYNRDGVI